MHAPSVVVSAHVTPLPTKIYPFSRSFSRAGARTRVCLQGINLTDDMRAREPVAGARHQFSVLTTISCGLDRPAGGAIMPYALISQVSIAGQKLLLSMQSKQDLFCLAKGLHKVTRFHAHTDTRT